MTIMVKKRFINETANDLILGKIHTLRANYVFWKKHDGKECSLRVWEDIPYRSKQIEICRKVIHIQKVEKCGCAFYLGGERIAIDLGLISRNDGFKNHVEFINWFHDYKDGDMAILHFTNFRY